MHEEVMGPSNWLENGLARKEPSMTAGSQSSAMELAYAGRKSHLLDGEKKR